MSFLFTKSGKVLSSLVFLTQHVNSFSGDGRPTQLSILKGFLKMFTGEQSGNVHIFENYREPSPEFTRCISGIWYFYKQWLKTCKGAKKNTLLGRVMAAPIRSQIAW